MCANPEHNAATGIFTLKQLSRDHLLFPVRPVYSTLFSVCRQRLLRLTHVIRTAIDHPTPPARMTAFISNVEDKPESRARPAVVQLSFSLLTH